MRLCQTEKSIFFILTLFLYSTALFPGLKILMQHAQKLSERYGAKDVAVRAVRHHTVKEFCHPAEAPVAQV